MNLVAELIRHAVATAAMNWYRRKLETTGSSRQTAAIGSDLIDFYGWPRS